MKTLSRPMFRMGGPIKQGIMHGIREPYRGGGKAALVGNPIYPSTLGREHHNIVLQTGSRVAPHIQKGWRAFQNLFRGAPTGQIIPGSATSQRATDLYKYRMAPVTNLEKIKSWFSTAPAGQWAAKDPAVKAAVSGTGYLGTPLRKGKDILKWGTTTPSGLLTSGIAAKTFWPDGTPKDSDVVKGIEKPGGYPDGKGKGKGTGSDGEFATAQRNDRVNKYLKMMGYDTAKKTAIADALIDASKIVSDRGTLNRKNITAELINPIIQATSARLDKPGQIREAVGLMLTKAQIEKDLEDPTVKALRMEQLKQLKGGFAKSIGEFVLSAKGGKVKQEALERYARAKADEHGLDFTVVTDEMIKGAGEGASEEAIIQSVVKDDGVYMIGDAIVQVSGGVPKRIS